ncbi:hypothetical protein JYU34_017799 [Plutella xylostella]|uniref:Uncharacterized protein n=1 Tax=Plutella xylostella TaxID=51655 RepID=A0ABQ7Q1Z0_PLUXY|nr:hypothetical protein JYU34_017799 [Plutella xylostella]
MDLQTQLYVTAGVLSGACLLLLVAVAALALQVSRLRRGLAELQGTRVRVQKLKLAEDQKHAFTNPTLSPDEELSRRGYTMYQASSDVESGRDRCVPTTCVQTGGQFLEELSKEIDLRQHRDSSAPRFLLQAIEDNKRKSREAATNSGGGHFGRASDTNPNFIY